MFGIVKVKNIDKWYGFITPEGGKKEDVFFHFSALEGGNDAFVGLEVWQRLEFDIKPGNKQWSTQAANISIVDEE